MSSDSEKREAMLPYFRKMRHNYHTRLLRAEAIKIFADGVIETKTAALLNPYIGTKNERGDPIYSQDSLNSFVRALDKSGFQVHVHAVGDRAIHMPLDAFEDAITVNGSRDSRHHITHLELIDPLDIPRFRALGVAANFQPMWVLAPTAALTRHIGASPIAEDLNHG